MKRRLLIGIIILAVIVGLVLLLPRFFARKSQNILVLSGNMEVTEINLGFKMPGRVVELLTDEGLAVQAGQVVARLDNAELTAAVGQVRAAMSEAAVRLAELRAGSRNQEIARAKAALSAQEAELSRTKKDYERAQYLHKNGAIPTTQFDAAKSSYEARLAQQKSAVESLSLIKEGPRKEDIRAAEERLAQAKAAVQAAEERLKDTVLHAPIKGVVLRKNIEPGETIAAGTPIFTIGDLSKPWIKVYVPENRYGLLHLGQKARITTDSGKKQKGYDGWISYIASEAEFTPKTVQTHEERVKLVFGVKVRVNDPYSEIKPGMPADVTIELQ